MATAAQSDSVLELYSAYFNRAADATGFTFWQKSFDTYLASADATATDTAKELFALQKIATDMSKATEYTALYPATQSTTDFITAIYTNLLGRPFDKAGLTFWVGKVDAGNLSKDNAIIEIIKGAKANTTAQGKLDAALIVNKNVVSKYFAETLKSDDVAVAKTAFAKLTNAATDGAAEVTAAKADLDATVANASATQLTTGTDNLSGTTSNDTFASANGTLQSSDSVIDSTATDADILNITTNIFNSTIQPTIIGIETINVSSASLPGLDLSNVKKATTININSTSSGGIAELTGTDATKGSIVAGSNIGSLKVTASAAGTGGGVSVDAGSASLVTITGGVGSDSFAVTTAKGLSGLTLKAGSLVATNDQISVELNGTATGGATLTVTNATAGTADLKSLILNAKTGAAVLNLTNVDVLASTLTLLGDQDITLVGSTAAMGTATNAITLVDGNSGTLTFKATTVAAADLSKAKFDVVDIAANLGGALKVNTNSTVKLSVDPGSANAITATGTLKVDNALTSGNFKATASATDNVTVEFNNSTVASSLATLDTGTTAGAGTVKLTGDKDLTITSLTAPKLDASAFGATLKVLGATAATNIIGGTGADQIKGSGSADTLLKGGEGTDIITSTAGADTIDLTETTSVKDTIKYSTALVAADADTIKGFATGVDKFDTDFVTSSLNFNFSTITQAIASGTASAVLDRAKVSGVIEITGATISATPATSDLITALGTSGITVTSGAKFLAILNNGTNSALYEVVDGATGGTVETADITVVGTFTNADLATGDII